MSRFAPSSYKVTTPPAAALISTADAKTHLRVDIADDDSYIDTLVAAASRLLEGWTGASLITRTIRASWNEAPPSGSRLILPGAPVQAVSSVTYDNAGSTETLLASRYELDATANLVAYLDIAAGDSWPSARRGMDAYVVTYTAGYGDAASDVPAPIIQAAKLLIGQWYSHRENVGAMGVAAVELPFAVRSLVDSYRSRWF